MLSKNRYGYPIPITFNIMYINVSPYKSAKRVRIVEEQFRDNKRTLKLIKHIGTAKNDEELEILKSIAEKERLELTKGGQLSFNFGQDPFNSLFTLGFYNHGAEVIFGGIFDSLGISIGRLTPLLRLLTVARIIHPGSKRNTADWMQETMGSGYSLDQIYRFLDVIFKKRKDIESALSDTVIKRYPNALTYLMYDVTTIYFEIDHEDDENNNALRKRGYSKDHRADMPQIVLGLCVNGLGMPLSHNLYPGHTYEGKTLIDSIQKTRNKLGNKAVTVVADAGMLSAKNLEAIKENGMHYIISARIKNLKGDLTKKIMTHDFEKEPFLETASRDSRLIVTYSKKRARADKARREVAVARLQKLINENKAIRKHRYLEFLGKQQARLDLAAIEADQKFDGLKGYLTNNFDLPSTEVISSYNQLPTVEQSFRMTKSDLKVRPVYHQLAKRIEAHVILCMISLCLIRILEQKLKAKEITFYQALKVINHTNSAVIGNKRKSHLIDPLYTKEFSEILECVKET